MHALLQLLGNLWVAFQLAGSIGPRAPHLSDREVGEVALYITAAGQETGVDPYMIAAIMWHESRFINMPKNSTNDYGLMQVHWRSPAPWLNGLTPASLMDPWTNILAGSRLLARMKEFCLANGHSQDEHYWWGHYRWGIVVRDSKYEQTVLWRYRALSRSADLGT